MAPLCVAGVVLGASRKGCGAPGRRWPAALVCVAGAVLKASRKGCGAPGRRWPAAPVCVALIISSASHHLTPLVAAGPRLLSVWQAQYSEPLERVGRRWPAAPVCVAGAVLTASRKGCGAPGRRWPAASVCVAGAVLTASRQGHVESGFGALLCVSSVWGSCANRR